MNALRSLARGLLAPPHDHVVAARAAGTFYLVGGVFIAVLSLTISEYARDVLAAELTMAAAFIAFGVLAWARPRAVPAWGLVLLPVVAVVLIVWMNHATRDTSTGSQLFALWPVLYAGMFLRAPQAAAVVVVVGAAEAWLLFTLMPASKAVADLAGIIVTMAISCGLLVFLRAREHTLRRALARQAMEDQLTGLPNRRAVDAAVDAALEGQSPGVPVSLLTLDVDLFKGINDTGGHHAGDETLRRIAGVLDRNVRHGDFVARLGGDEFVVLLRACDAPAARAVAESLRTAVAGEMGGVTISVGVATTVAGDGATATDLFRASDEALYASKQAGRNVVSGAPVVGRQGTPGEA
ncbi:MAG: GGDEF domain-containing protein [Thermoleophilia bacterium]|nr:GGDEF domain-containing protein [Thermoleophilia bacterium]